MFPGRWWHEPTAQDGEVTCFLNCITMIFNIIFLITSLIHGIHVAFRLTWVSLLFEVAAATGGIIGFVQTESSLILAFALENIVDLLSSSVVLWRFYAPSGSDEAQLAKLQAREERANVSIHNIFRYIFTLVLGYLRYFCISEQLTLSHEKKMCIIRWRFRLSLEYWDCS